MTFVGHGLAGAAIALLLLPPNRNSLRYRCLYFLAIVPLSSLPDYRFKGWGHDQYAISHSLFVNLAIIAVLAAVLCSYKKTARFLGAPRAVAAGALVWLSHLLLDSFYNHGRGIAIFWPFSKARLALPIPWLEILKPVPPPMTMQAVGVYSLEFVTFFPILFLAWYITSRRRTSNPLAAQSGP